MGVLFASLYCKPTQIRYPEKKTLPPGNFRKKYCIRPLLRLLLNQLETWRRICWRLGQFLWSGLKGNPRKTTSWVAMLTYAHLFDLPEDLEPPRRQKNEHCGAQGGFPHYARAMTNPNLPAQPNSSRNCWASSLEPRLSLNLAVALHTLQRFQQQPLPMSEITDPSASSLSTPIPHKPGRPGSSSTKFRLRKVNSSGSSEILLKTWRFKLQASTCRHACMNTC